MHEILAGLIFGGLPLFFGIRLIKGKGKPRSDSTVKQEAVATPEARQETIARPAPAPAVQPEPDIKPEPVAKTENRIEQQPPADKTPSPEPEPAPSQKTEPLSPAPLTVNKTEEIARNLAATKEAIAQPVSAPATAPIVRPEPKQESQPEPQTKPIQPEDDRQLGAEKEFLKRAIGSIKLSVASDDDGADDDDEEYEYESPGGDIRFYYENMQGDKGWHTVEIKKLEKDRAGNIRVIVEGRGGDDIAYNTARILKMGDGSNPQEFFREMYAPIEKEIQKMVSEHKSKADKIIRAMEGFDDAEIFHCSFEGSIAISKNGIIAVMSKKEWCSFVKQAKEITNMTFNKQYARCTIYIKGFQPPTVGIEMSIDFCNQLETFDRLKAAWNKARAA